MQNDQVSNIAAAAIFIAVENQSPKNSYAAPSQPTSTGDSIGSNAANQALLREMATIAEDLQKNSSPQDLDDFSDLAGELQTGNHNNNSIFSPASNSYNNNNNNGGTGHWNGDRTNDVSNLLKQIANGSGNGQMAEEKLALKLLRDAMNGGSSDVQSQLRDLLNMAGGQGNSNSGGYGNNGGYGNYNNNGGNGNYNNNLGLFNNNNNGYGNNGYGNYNNNNNGGYGNDNNNLGIFNNGNNNGYGNSGYGNYNNNNNGGYGNYNNNNNGGYGNNNNNNNLGNFGGTQGGNQGVNYGSTEGDGPDGSDGSCDNNNDNGSNIGNNAFSNLLQQLGSVCGNMSNSGSNNGQLGQLLNNLVNGSNSGNNNNNYGSQLSNLNQGLSDQSNILNSARYGNHNNNGGNYGQDHSNLDDMLRSLAQNDCGPNQGGNSGAYEGNNGFDFKSWGDPHIETNLDGKSKSADRMQDNPNFNTVYNTNGGQTRVGTTETPEKNGVTFNDQVNIHHSGRDEWHVNSDHQDDGTVKTTVSDKYGNHVLKDGDSVMEGDGSKISQADGKVVVSQKTSGGGSVDTTITNNGQGLDVDEKGAGHVVMDGQAVRQATKS